MDGVFLTSSARGVIAVLGGLHATHAQVATLYPTTNAGVRGTINATRRKKIAKVVGPTIGANALRHVVEVNK